MVFKTIGNVGSVQVLTAIHGLLFTFLATRLLSPQMFGELRYVLLLLPFLMVATLPSFDILVLRECSARSKVNLQAVVRKRMQFGFFGALNMPLMDAPISSPPRLSASGWWIHEMNPKSSRLFMRDKVLPLPHSSNRRRASSRSCFTVTRAILVVGVPLPPEYRKVRMDDDVCYDRRCWATVNGHFTGDVLEGGRVDATTWPVQSGQAIDVWFNKSTDPAVGTWDAGYFRGVVDKASQPTPQGQQKLDIDYPDELTSGELT